MLRVGAVCEMQARARRSAMAWGAGESAEEVRWCEVRARGRRERGGKIYITYSGWW